MKKLIATLFAISTIQLSAQYTDYVGAGHNDGITITSSSSEDGSTAANTMDGSGMDSPYFTAGRFLEQATLGASRAEIDELHDTYGNDFEKWIDDQMAQDPDYLRQDILDMWEYLEQSYLNLGRDPEDIYGPYYLHFNYQWWQHFHDSNDRLRAKMAYALSQVLVISVNSDLLEWAEAQSYYYDLLIEHSMGNYKDLLMDVTYSVPMGYYLSHFNNPREFPEENIHPDENYAREIMQLFTIGLYELNIDGSRKLDGSGNPIPTYGQADIKELAQVFTGLGPSSLNEYGDMYYDEPQFGVNLYVVNKDEAMTMYDFFHDKSPKELIGGVTLPADQTGEQDIEQAVDHLFNHPNVGPFLAKRLIQRLVKSNPSPQYIQRVAEAFNNNGSGVRGDMKAVIKAILLDTEARSGDLMKMESAGKFREPMLRLTNFGKGIGMKNELDLYWHNGYTEARTSGQAVLGSPTVFNFYPPDFAPNGEIKEAGLVAPEFKLHNTSQAVTYQNTMFNRAIWGVFGFSWEFNSERPSIHTREQTIIYTDNEWMYPLAEYPELLLNQLDKLMTYGQLSDRTRAIVREAITEIDWPGQRERQNEYRTKMAIYLIQFSPDYNILK